MWIKAARLEVGQGQTALENTVQQWIVHSVVAVELLVVKGVPVVEGEAPSMRLGAPTAVVGVIAVEAPQAPVVVWRVQMKVVVVTTVVVVEL